MNTRRTACLALFGALLLTVAASCADLPDDTPPTPTVAVAIIDEAPLPTPIPMPEAPATPTAPVIGAHLLALREQMQAAVDATSMPGEYAVAVTDLQTGETVSVNGDVQRLSGCVMNLFVILQVARDLQDGRYDVSRADSLIAATTWSSNAATARELYALAGDGDVKHGVERVDAFIRDVLGLDGVAIDHPPLYMADTIGRDYNNWITAEDVNRALAALWDGDILEPHWRDYVLDHLVTVKPGLNYLTAHVPEGTVSHKNGFLVADTGYVDNDAGIVRLQRGGVEVAYAVTFLSQEVPVKYGDAVLGQQISRLAYDVMAARYP
jgi:beta-lactamase class A